MLTVPQTLLLTASLLPYLGLSAYDGWLHEKARKVPRFEQALHAVLAVTAATAIFALFTARPHVAVPALAVFALAACADEFGFHGQLAMRERRLHHVAYASFAGFLVVAVVVGALRWP
jgi:hypothetical protein